MLQCINNTNTRMYIGYIAKKMSHFLPGKKITFLKRAKVTLGMIKRRTDFTTLLLLNTLLLKSRQASKQKVVCFRHNKHCVSENYFRMY